MSPEHLFRQQRRRREREGKKGLVSRREFLIGGGVVGVGLVAVAILRPWEWLAGDPNRALIVELRKELGITPSTTRKEFAATAAKIVTENPEWMMGRRFQYQTDLGKTTGLEITLDGEIFSVGDFEEISVAYPDARVPDFTNESRLYTFPNNRHFALYGVQATLDRLDPHQDIFKTFTEEYFAESQVPSGLHVIFLPLAHQVNLIDANNFGLPKAQEGKIAHVITLFSSEDNGYRILGFEVVVVIPEVHYEAGKLNASPTRELTNTLANEMTNLLIDQELRPTTLNIPVSPAEAVSSIAGLLSQIDPGTAQMILGGRAHENFVGIIAEEMEKIGQIRVG